MMEGTSKQQLPLAEQANSLAERSMEVPHLPARERQTESTLLSTRLHGISSLPYCRAHADVVWWQAVVEPCRRCAESLQAWSPSMFSKAEARNTAPLATRPAPRHILHATAASRPPSTPSITRRKSCCGSWDQCSDAPVPCR
jgi:hypothetical protein